MIKFCLSDSPLLQERIRDLQKKFPNKSEVELKAELTAAANNLNTFEVPTMEQMNAYYEATKDLRNPVTQNKGTSSGYTDEMRSIKREALKNGTFMKAPNGNPTNLNERQWLQVRTKAFKDWFGDWERAAMQKFGRWGAYNKTRASYEGVEVTGQEFDPDMAPDGGTRLIWLGNEQIGEIPTEETLDKIRMAGSIGAATEIFEPMRGKGYGKKAHIALALIAANDGKTLYSDSSNSDAEDALWKSLVKDGVAEIVEERPKTGNWNHTTYRIINSALPQGEVHGYDENVSKVVDENGEPLVVYHGSPNHGFTVFSKSSPNRFGRTTQGLDKKFYFTKDRITSRQFSLRDEELEALFYADIEEGEYPEIEINNTELDSRIYPVFLNIRKPVYINAEDKAVYQLSDNERAEIDNSEGAIIENALEQLPTRILELMPEADEYLLHPFTTDYLVSNPNQIKSAEGNNGEFSEENDNIYQEGERDLGNAPRRDSRLAELQRIQNEKGNIGVARLINLIDENSEFSPIINLLKSRQNSGAPLLSGIKVQLYDTLVTPNRKAKFNGRRAYYDAATKTIVIDTNADYRDGRADSVIMHEVMHAITVNRILNNTKFREEFDSIIDEYNKHFRNYRYRRPSNLGNTHYMEEFIADIWSNRTLIENLKAIPTKNKLTLWDRIKRFFTKIFRGADNTMLADASDTLYRLLDEPEIVNGEDTYYEGEDNQPAQTINIWHGSGENADLSNLAVRPFTIKGVTFNTVEHFFQYTKAKFAKDDDTASKIIQAKTGYDARKLGRQVKGLDSNAWDAKSSEFMETGIRASFLQNPQALQKLRDTGNARLTHTQDTGKWGTEFPRIN